MKWLANKMYMIVLRAVGAALMTFFDRYLHVYFEKLILQNEELLKKLEKSQKLPCFVVVRGVDSKDQPIEFASGIKFLARGEKCELKIKPQKDALNLKVYIEAPFVITDAMVGNRCFSWSESQTGECAFRELSIFECKVGMHITVEARYPGEETEGFT